ncbi:MAG: hypothetical protein U0414_31940 [Polyangiaceae bacterium]
MSPQLSYQMLLESIASNRDQALIVLALVAFARVHGLGIEEMNAFLEALPDLKASRILMAVWSFAGPQILGLLNSVPRLSEGGSS